MLLRHSSLPILLTLALGTLAPARAGAIGAPVTTMATATEAATTAPAPEDAPVRYRLGMADAAHHLFDIDLSLVSPGPELVLLMPVWTPGYYQRMDYADQVRAFDARDAAGRPLPWRRDGQAWHIAAPRGTPVSVRYRVLAERDFVASLWLDTHKGYVSPAGAFLYPADGLNRPVDLAIAPLPGWTVATGLPQRAGEPGAYRAADFDTLYDSPILIGTLERLPAFAVRGVPHYLVGENFGTTDRPRLVDDMRRIVTAATDLIGDVPYRDYSFLEIGQTRGGIEHLNSTAVGFGTQDNRTPAGRLRLDRFLAHEYFHNFNVKRIRPMELGPFDYQKENRTNLLWVSEGLTVYYEDVILRRAGLIDRQTLLDDMAGYMRAYENEPGHLFQSLTQASYETWEDGPFGRKDDPFNRTISYYDKGPVLGFMLDLAIRHATENRRSLDDAMRTLYRRYYREKGRGFTDAEFRATCEEEAGMSLAPLFAYVETTAEPDYARYFAYAGLAVDTAEHPVPGGWLGITLAREEPAQPKTGAKRAKTDPAGTVPTRAVADVDYESPAWKAGIRRGDRIFGTPTIRDGAAGPARLKPQLGDMKPGTTLTLTVERDGTQRSVPLVLGTRLERHFTLTPMPHPDALQKAILESF